MSAAGTMAWKELRELLMAEGRPALQMAVAVLLDLFIGIVIPFYVGLALHLTDWPAVLGVLVGVAGFCAFMGFVGPLPLVGDAFAGERERHTLETLLAGPLPDGAIVRGKMLAQYALVGGHVAVVALAAAITATVLFGVEGLALLPGALVAGFLAAAVPASFIIGLGSLVSLRAPTAKKAQERVSLVMMPVFFVPALGPMLFRSSLLEASPTVRFLVFALAPAVVIVGSILCNVLVFTRFQRDRLLGLP